MINKTYEYLYFRVKRLNQPELESSEHYLLNLFDVCHLVMNEKFSIYDINTEEKV
jgi:hypothetical protein